MRARIVFPAAFPLEEDFKIFLVTEGTEIYRTSRVIDIIRLGPPIYSWKHEDTRVSLNLFHEDRERIS